MGVGHLPGFRARTIHRRPTIRGGPPSRGGATTSHAFEGGQRGAARGPTRSSPTAGRLSAALSGKALQETVLSRLSGGEMAEGPRFARRSAFNALRARKVLILDEGPPAAFDARAENSEVVQALQGAEATGKKDRVLITPLLERFGHGRTHLRCGRRASVDFFWPAGTHEECRATPAFYAEGSSRCSGPG